MEYDEDEFCNKSFEDVINCTIEYKKHLKDTVNLKPEAVAVPLTFAVIFLVGVTGNVLLTLNFARHKKLSTPHNAFVVNLAVGDLLMLFISVPFNSIWYTVPYWQFGDFLCRLSRFAETLATTVTIATLTVLSVERFFIVTGRRRHRSLSTTPTLVIVIVWVAGFVLALPDFISPTVFTPPANITATASGDSEDEQAEFCLDFNPDWGKTYPKVNILTKFLLLFCVPLLIIGPCYLGLAIHILFKMFGSRNAPNSKTPLRSATVATSEGRGSCDDNETEQQPQDEMKEGVQCRTQRLESLQNDFGNNSSFPDGGGRKIPTRKRRRLAVTVLGLVLCFLVCWLPRHVFLIWFYFDPDLFNAFWHVFKIIGFCLMFSNSAVNPFVFYVLDVRFRAFVHAAILCGKRKNRYENGDGGAGENGVANPETLAVDMSAVDDRKTHILMSEMAAGADTGDAI